MAIQTSNPIVIPATTIPEKVYDKVWFTSIHIQAPELYSGEGRVEPRAVMTYKLYNDTDGFCPDSEDSFVIENIFTQSAIKQKIGAAMYTLFAALEEEGKNKAKF